MKKRYSRTQLTASLLVATATLAATCGHALANPNGGSVVAGQATIVQTAPAQVTITQSTDKAIINWNSFSIGAGEQTRFVQPSSNSITLNRVTGPDVSQILGQLTANGRIVLVNPNGVFFGKDSQVDVAALIATSHDIKNDDFMVGKLNFTIPGKPGAQIINQGKITVQEGGLVALVAPSVQNSGLITARLGKVALASANSFTIDLYGDDLILFAADSAITRQLKDALGNPLSAAVENSGTIEANGGWVLLTAEVAKNVVDKAINMTGHIKATTVDQQEGTIILKAMGGEVAVAGTLDASAPNGGDGGFIETSGAHVAIDPVTARITTVAPFGKTGHWLLDPTDYIIAASGGNITGAALAGYLAATNVEVQTAASGSGNGDIFVNDSVTWNTTNELILAAYRNIHVNEAINGAGGGRVTLRADAEGTGLGTVSFSGNGHITVTHPWAWVEIYYNPVSYGDAATKSTLVNNPFSGNVTRNDGSFLLANMLVNNVNQLQDMNTNLYGRYALGKDIDASATAGWNGGAGFVPIGFVNNSTVNHFLGYFNGEGHVISNLTINRPSTSFVALIGASDATVCNVGLVNNNFTGDHFVGGLVALNSVGGSIVNSYVTGSVIGADTVGGLAGESRGAIFNSYATCSVSSTDPALAGGLVAVNSGVVSDSYWDTQASGQATSAGGTGLTTAQMKQQASFSGWDFANIWQIVEGVSRPTLKVASAQSATVLTPTGDTPSGNADSSLLISYTMPQDTYERGIAAQVYEVDRPTPMRALAYSPSMGSISTPFDAFVEFNHAFSSFMGDTSKLMGNELLIKNNVDAAMTEVFNNPATGVDENIIPKRDLTKIVNAAWSTSVMSPLRTADAIGKIGDIAGAADKAISKFKELKDIALMKDLPRAVANIVHGMEDFNKSADKLIILSHLLTESKGDHIKLFQGLFNKRKELFLSQDTVNAIKTIINTYNTARQAGKSINAVNGITKTLAELVIGGSQVNYLKEVYKEPALAKVLIQDEIIRYYKENKRVDFLNDSRFKNMKIMKAVPDTDFLSYLGVGHKYQVEFTTIAKR